MVNSNSTLITGKDGLRGRLLAAPAGSSGGAQAVIQLDNGQEVHVPASLLRREPDGSYSIPLSANDVQQSGAGSREHSARQETVLVVPVYEEVLSVGKRTVDTGGARITKHVTEREETVDEPILRQDVQIEHVAINRVWDGPPPPPRYEADKIIIPLLEEVLVVEKRLMLKEELHISRVQKTVHEPQKVALRSESVTVERVEHSAEQETSNLKGTQ